VFSAKSADWPEGAQKRQASEPFRRLRPVKVTAYLPREGQNPMPETIWRGTKAILFLGFGCLLLLVGVLGLGAYRRSGRIYRDITSIHDSYLQQVRLLNDIQSDIYLSSILVRDFLLDPDPEAVSEHRRELLEIRASLESRLSQLQGYPAPAQRDRVLQLREELAGYWMILDPIFDWTPERKESLSFSFLKERVLPRRTAMTQMARRIAQLNAWSLEQEQERIDLSRSSYDKYLRWMFGCALALALFTAVVSIRRLTTLEKRSDGHRKRLEEAERRLRWLSQKLVHTQEEERKSLSRELHDEIGQMLTGIRMAFGSLEQLHPGATADFRRQLSEGKGIAEETLQKVRNLALGLRPSMLDDLGLVPALEWLAREFSRRSGIPVEFSAEGSLEGIPENTRTCIYRVVQESLTNCARHAQAQRVWIDLQHRRSEMILTVRDDGVGFNPSQPDSRGLGLVGIEERIRELGGEVTISSRPGSGTMLHAALPVLEEGDRE
jgi:signal transduction histidine kinase